MWSTDTPWFDVALILSFSAFGCPLFGRFEEHKPRWRRLLKVVVVTALLVGVSITAGRGWMYALVGAILAAVVVIHAWWLPRHGVNGWTAEPRERYYALLGLDAHGRRVRPPARPTTEAHP